MKNPAPANYFLFDMVSKRTIKEGTLGELFREVRHAAEFGIANCTTLLPVVYRTMSGYKLPIRLASAFPAIEEKLVRRNYMFQYR